MQEQEQEQIKKYKITKIRDDILKSSFLVDLFYELNQNNIKFYLAGGSVLTSVQLSEQIKSKYNDLDLYFGTQKDFDLAFKIIKTNIDTVHEVLKEQEIPKDELWSQLQDIAMVNIDSPNAVSFDINDIKLQFIRMNFGTPQEIIKDFDIENSKYWSYYPFETAQTYQNKDTLYNLKTSWIDNYFCLQRVQKYSDQKSLCIDEYTEDLFDNIMTDNIDFQVHNSNYIIPDSEEKGYKIKYLGLSLQFSKFIDLVNEKFHKGIEFNWDEFEWS